MAISANHLELGPPAKKRGVRREAVPPCFVDEGVRFANRFVLIAKNDVEERTPRDSCAFALRIVLSSFKMFVLVFTTFRPWIYEAPRIQPAKPGKQGRREAAPPVIDDVCLMLYAFSFIKPETISRKYWYE